MNVSGTIDAILNQKSTDIWSVSPDETVYDAVKMMAEKNVGALVVVEDGKLVGIISVSGAPGGDKDEVCAQAAIAKIQGRF